MKHTDRAHTGSSLLHRINQIPGKIVRVHDHDHVAHAVLHELCHPSCFDIQKAAYFVDNPDFDVMQGVAGIARDELRCELECAWEQPDRLSSELEKSSFNGNVRNCSRKSMSGHQQKEVDVVQELASQLHIEHPDYVLWPMKHHNVGILIFEHNGQHSWDTEHLRSGVHLLSFCPIA